MFGKNEIVGQKFFEGVESNKLMVTSIFFTLQGEGPFSGRPALFVRLSKCQLACHFCDTAFDNGDYLTFDEILCKGDEEVASFFDKTGVEIPLWAKNREYVLVITGGEPTLQKNLSNFLFSLKDKYKDVQIESNGILFLLIPKDTVLVVSPKCLEEDGVPQRYLKPNKYVLQRANCLKFVVENPSYKKTGPYSSIPEWALEWKNQTGNEIYVSPMNIYQREPQKMRELKEAKGCGNIKERSTIDETISFWEEGLLNRAANQANHEFAAFLCMRYGLKLSLQTHLYASLP